MSDNSHITAQIPTALHRRVKMQAELEDRPVSALVRRALEAYLVHARPQTVGEAMARYTLSGEPTPLDGDTLKES